MTVTSLILRNVQPREHLLVRSTDKSLLLQRKMVGWADYIVYFTLSLSVKLALKVTVHSFQGGYATGRDNFLPS